MALLLLCGCAASKPQSPEGARDAAFISRTLSYTLHARARSLKIGTPDCSVPESSDVYFRICKLPVDGKLVPVGLRFDARNERIIPHMFWALVQSARIETLATGVARYEYDVAGNATCPGKRVRVLPPGAASACSIETRSGRRYAIEVAVIKGLYAPYAVVSDISGLHLEPQIAALKAQIADQLRGPDTIPGSLVVRYFTRTTLPYFKNAAPELGAGKFSCPRFISPGDLNGFCTLDVSFGYLRVGVDAGDDDQIYFHTLSVPVDMQAAERAGKRLAEAKYRRGNAAVVAKVDCGTDKIVALPIPSVHYCDVKLSNGETARIGVEYYDEIEGIHLSLERQLSQTASQ